MIPHRESEVGSDFLPIYHTETSEECGDLMDRIAKLQSELVAVPRNRSATIKTSQGNGYTYHYADLADCRKVLKPVLAKHGLALFHTTEPSRISAGEVMLVTWLTLGNQWMRSYLPLGQLPADPRSLGGRLSYFKRYAECAITGLVIDDEDNETELGEAQTREQKEARTKALSSSLKEAIKVHSGTINAVKDGIAANDLSTAAEAWYELPAEEQRLLYTAPSKGGPFTTVEREILKSSDFRQAHYGK